VTVEDWPSLSGDMQQLDHLIAREILYLRTRYQLSLDEFRGLYISDAQVDRLVAQSRNRSEAEPASNADPLTLGIDSDADSPVRRTARRLALDPVESDILLIAVAPEIDLKYETLFAYLNDDVTRKWPTADLTQRLLRHAGHLPFNVRNALRPQGTLTRLGILKSIESPSGRPSSLNAGFALSPPAVHAVLGIDGVSPDLSATASRSTATGEWCNLAVPSTLMSELRRVPDVIRSAEPPPLFIFLGERGSPRSPAIAAIARSLDLELLHVHLTNARSGGMPLAQLAQSLALDVRLRPAAVVVDQVGDGLERGAPELRSFFETLRSGGAPVFLCASPDVEWQPAVAGMASLPIVFTEGGFADRRRLWTRAIERVGIDVGDSTAFTIASRFQFSACDIELAASTAGYLAALDGRVAPRAEKDVVEAARRLVGHDFGSLGSKVSRRCGWDDLVLPESTLARLRELSAAIERRHLVFDEWGFNQHTTGGAGVVALFAGASGTGKTMTAAVIANELGFDLYRIDLSSVVSKYIGETEKNLDRIFRAARSGHVMLFFDEADALFGKRSEVKDAHDRYANIEVAFLLQRLEEHDGVVVLATNLRRNVDDAFARRMQFVIEFSPPDPALREQLWRTIFPPTAPLAGDIDWPFLAKQFTLTGGEIRNVALDAAFLAARNGGTITMPDIIHAMARQIVKQGKMPTGSEFGAYFPLVTGMP
jgi:hypothetical protein